MDSDELSAADDELRSRLLLSLRLGARTADAADAIVSASRFCSYSFRFTPLHYLLFRFVSGLFRIIPHLQVASSRSHAFEEEEGAHGRAGSQDPPPERRPRSVGIRNVPKTCS